MKGLYTILLLVFSNIFMTFAWYGHLKLQEMKITNNWPLIAVILLSWGMAFFEYTLQVPANRIGFQANGGPFSLLQLKVIQAFFSLKSFRRLLLSLSLLFSPPFSFRANPCVGTTWLPLSASFWLFILFL